MIFLFALVFKQQKNQYIFKKFSKKSHSLESNEKSFDNLLADIDLEGFSFFVCKQILGIPCTGPAIILRM